MPHEKRNKKTVPPNMVAEAKVEVNPLFKVRYQRCNELLQAQKKVDMEILLPDSTDEWWIRLGTVRRVVQKIIYDNHIARNTKYIDLLLTQAQATIAHGLGACGELSKWFLLDYLKAYRQENITIHNVLVAHSSNNQIAHEFLLIGGIIEHQLPVKLAQLLDELPETTVIVDRLLDVIEDKSAQQLKAFCRSSGMDAIKLIKSYSSTSLPPESLDLIKEQAVAIHKQELHLLLSGFKAKPEDLECENHAKKVYIAIRDNDTILALSRLIEKKTQNNPYLHQAFDQKMTALHWACLFANDALINALRLKGALMDTPMPDSGHTPLDCLGYSLDMMKKIVGPEEKLEVDQAARETLKTKLIKEGCYSPWLLRQEASVGNENIVKLLIKNAPDRIDEAGAATGCTALHQAAAHGQMAVCTILLDEHATIEQEDNKGNTPLLLAILKKQWATVDLLLTRGAQVQHANKEGLTPEKALARRPKKVVAAQAEPVPNYQPGMFPAVLVDNNAGKTTVFVPDPPM